MTLRKVVWASCVIATWKLLDPYEASLGSVHLEVEDAVDLQLGVVLGDADLAGNVERDFPQVVPVGDAIDERDHEIEPGLQHRVEPPQPLDDERVLLRNDPDRLGDDDDGHDEQRDREQRRPDPHGVGLHLRPGHCAGFRSDSTSTEPRIAVMYIVSRRGTSGAASSASQSDPR